MSLRLAMMLAASVLLTGCMEYRVVSNGWADLEELAAQTGDQARKREAQRNGQGQELSGYTIELARFDGDRRFDRASRAVQTVHQKLGYSGAWTLDRDNVTRVLLGRFASPTEPMARLMLEDVRAIEVDGKRRFEQADVVPIAGGRVAQNPLDAANYPGFFTLQIGFYDSAFEGDRQAAAEEAVRVLRDEGEEAYFYHGPHLSLVCVGLFTQHDFVQKSTGQSGVDAYGPRIVELQKRFPHNLGNGLTVEESINGQSLGAQASCLVRIF